MVTHIYFNMFSWEKRQGWDFRDEAMRCTWAVLLMPTPFLYFTEKKTEKLLISMVSFLNKLFYYTEIEPNLAHLPFFFFNWSIVDLQCCVSFWCTAKWFIYVCVCVCVCVCVDIYFFIFFALWFIIGCWIWFPVLHNRTLLFIFLYIGACIC